LEALCTPLTASAAAAARVLDPLLRHALALHAAAQLRGRPPALRPDVVGRLLSLLWPLVPPPERLEPGVAARAPLALLRIVARLSSPDISLAGGAATPLALLCAWLAVPAAGGADGDVMRASFVDLVCTLVKRTDGGSLQRLQAAGVGPLLVGLAGDPASPMVTRVAALVSVGALRERVPELASAAWWRERETQSALRLGVAKFLDTLAETAGDGDTTGRPRLLAHFHSSPGGRPARARMLLHHVRSGDDETAVLLAGARLAIASAPERLAAAGRDERRALRDVPGLREGLLALAAPGGCVLRERLGALLLGHVAAAEAMDGACETMRRVALHAVCTAAMPPTVTLRLLPEPGAPYADAGCGQWPALLPASRELLSAHSPALAALFAGPLDGAGAAAEVELRGVPPRGAQLALGWAASGALAPASLAEALQVLAFAARFLVPRLEEAAEAIAVDMLAPDNVCELMSFAELSGRDRLRDWAVRWAVRAGLATQLVASGALAALPLGAQQALMLAIAQAADEAVRGGGEAAASASAAAEEPEAKKPRL